jgi:hypothetical protein
MRVALPFSDGVPGRVSGAAAGGVAGAGAPGTSLDSVSNSNSQDALNMSESRGHTPAGDEWSIPVTIGFIRDRLSP